MLYAGGIALEIASTSSLSIIALPLKANCPADEMPDKYAERLYTTPISANQHPSARR